MTRHSSLIPLAAALALTGALAGPLAGCSKPKAKTTEAQNARAVTVVTLTAHPISGALAASGDLVPREEAAVLPEVAGYRVAKVLVDVGDQVKRGQTLVELDPTLIQAQLAQSEASAAQAQANAAQAQDQANRVKDLDNAGVLSQEAIDQRRFQARAQQAAAAVQQAALKDLRTRLSKLQVAAPVSGVVLERTVRPGDISSLGGTPWFRLARDNEIELAAQLSEDDLAKIRPGQHAQVTLPSGLTVPGVVRLVSPQVDNATKLGIVRVRLPVNRDIRAGGFGRAVFDEVSGNVLSAPETAVTYDADGASVTVVNADNRVKHVPVVTGQRGGGYVQLIKGPPAGSRIVQNAAAFLQDGDLVKVAGAPAPQPVQTASAASSKAAPNKAARR